MEEERINFHFYKQSPCKKCTWRGNGTCCGCPSQQEYDNGITYSEFIKKIAKSIHDKIVNTNAQASCLELAESVISDLLEKGDTK